MVESRNQEILDTITNFYLSSRDFNGVPVHDLTINLGIVWEDFVDNLSHLIRSERVGVVFIDTDANPHILRIGCEPIGRQLEKLPTADLHACAYPLPKHLEDVVERSQYETRPYALALALGRHQLKFLPFDLSVLEFYRNHPRYSYSNDGIHSRIYFAKLGV